MPSKVSPYKYLSQTQGYKDEIKGIFWTTHFLLTMCHFLFVCSHIKDFALERRFFSRIEFASHNWFLYISSDSDSRQPTKKGLMISLHITYNALWWFHILDVAYSNPNLVRIMIDELSFILLFVHYDGCMLSNKQKFINARTKGAMNR